MTRNNNNARITNDILAAEGARTMAAYLRTMNVRDAYDLDGETADQDTVNLAIARLMDAADFQVDPANGDMMRARAQELRAIGSRRFNQAHRFGL